MSPWELYILVTVPPVRFTLPVFWNTIFTSTLSPILKPLGSKVRLTISPLGSPIVAFLVGVGAAAAIGGATLGTLFPQVSASVNLFDIQAIIQSGQGWLAQLFFGGVILFGTLATFIYFQFNLGSQNSRFSHLYSYLKYISWIGQAFIAITFGVLYAGVLGAALSALIERVNFLWSFLISFVLPAS